MQVRRQLGKSDADSTRWNLPESWEAEDNQKHWYRVSIKHQFKVFDRGCSV